MALLDRHGVRPELRWGWRAMEDFQVRLVPVRLLVERELETAQKCPQISHQGRARAEKSGVPVLRCQVLIVAVRRLQGSRQCRTSQVKALQMHGGGM